MKTENAKKYVDELGNEIKPGDLICIAREKKVKGNVLHEILETTVGMDIIKDLVDEGLIKEVEADNRKVENNNKTIEDKSADSKNKVGNFSSKKATNKLKTSGKESSCENNKNNEKAIIDAAIANIAARYNWSTKKTENFLVKMSDKMPECMLQLLIKEIARVMDSDCLDHISKNKYLYYISMMNGNIYSTPTSNIYSYITTGYFRSQADAELCKKILKVFFSSLFRKPKSDKCNKEDNNNAK